MLQYSHTAHQRIPASKQTQPVQILSEFLVQMWFLPELQLTEVFLYWLNRLVGSVEQETVWLYL